MIRSLYFLAIVLIAPGASAGDIKTIAELVTPGLATAKTDFSRALLLRDQVHRSYQPNSGILPTTTAELHDADAAYRKSVLELSRSNSCNGKAILYIAALKAYGIDARMVQLYSGKMASSVVWSHASVDVRIDGQWVAMDPTFNVSFKRESGVLLSWSEVVERTRGGKYVLPHSDGQRVLRDRSIEDVARNQGYRLEDLVKYVLMGPWGDGPAVNLTPGWDGKVRYMTGDTFDAWESITSPFYAELARAPQ